MSDTPHICFTVAATRYLANLDREDLRAEHIAVLYQAAPKRLDDGRTSHGLNMPVLITSLYLAERQEVAEKVAALLNRHWDDEESSNELAALRKENADLKAQGERQSSTIAIHHQNFDEIYERACRETGEFAEWVRSITHPEADQR